MRISHGRIICVREPRPEIWLVKGDSRAEPEKEGVSTNSTPEISTGGRTGQSWPL